MNHGTAFYHDERCLWHTTGEAVLGGMPLGGCLQPQAAGGHPEHSYDPNGSKISMRLPNAAHESRPWRICEIVPDFTLEDAWALPVHFFRAAEAFGDEEERLLELWLSGWSIPNLPTARGFAETAGRAGLERPSMRGVTAELWPSLRSLRRHALLGLPAKDAPRARSFRRSPARGGRSALLQFEPGPADCGCTGYSLPSDRCPEPRDVWLRSEIVVRPYEGGHLDV